MRHATCRCGAVRASVAGEPVRVSVCHCNACKRRTGSAFGFNATWPDAAVTITGDRRRWSRIADSGGEVRYDFCAACGSTVAYTLDARPGMISLPVGGFADSGFPPPQVEIYGEQAQGGIGRQLDDDAQE